MSDPLSMRVLRRWAAENEIPVKNKDTGRTVYVLPETMKKEPGRFEKMQPNDSGDPRYRGKPKPPRSPRKPRRPRLPVDPPPAPIKPELPPKEPEPAKPVKPVLPVKPPKVPEPSPHRKWTKPRQR